MFLVSSCSCLSLIHWSQALNWEWRWSWSSANRRGSNYIWMINKQVNCLLRCDLYYRFDSSDAAIYHHGLLSTFSSGNDLLHLSHRAITWSSADLSSVGPLRILQTSMKFWNKLKRFHSRKCFWKCCLQNCKKSIVFIQENAFEKMNFDFEKCCLQNSGYFGSGLGCVHLLLYAVNACGLMVW